MSFKSSFYVGQKFNYLTIINNEFLINKNRTEAMCSCVCGKQIMVPLTWLKRNAKKSCGCISLHKKPNLKNRKYDSPKESSITGLFNRYRNTARKGRKDFLISIDEFKEIIFQCCYYCNAEPSAFYNVYMSKKGRKRSGDSQWIEAATIYTNGIDRLNSDIGYILYNCVPCCKDCNFAKNDKTLQEFKEWLIKVYQNFIK